MCDTTISAFMILECSKLPALMGENLSEATPSNMVTPEMDPGGPVISDRIMNIFMYSNMVLRGSISAFGSVNNLINMIIFYRLGLKDSMSVGLMALSFSDFLVTFLGLAGTSYFAWEIFFPDTAIDPTSVGAVTWGWWRDIIQLISAWITTFLSVERCICVVFPFKVKQIFTRTRSIIVIIVIYIVNIAIHMPVIASQWLGWTKVEEKIGNETVLRDRLIVMFTDNRPQIQFYIDIANGAVLPFPSQIIVIVSVIWMIYGLRSTSRIRSGKLENDKEKNNMKKESNLSDKERKLVRVVLFLAVILTFCNLPRFLAVYAKQIFAEVSIGREHQYIYTLLWSLAAFAGICNSSVNVFVYLLINRSYLAEFKQLFKCCKI